MEPADGPRREYRPFPRHRAIVMRHAGTAYRPCDRHVPSVVIPPGALPLTGPTSAMTTKRSLTSCACAFRAGVTFIGEDLGTVEPWARDVLDRGILHHRPGVRAGGRYGPRPQRLAH